MMQSDPTMTEPPKLLVLTNADLAGGVAVLTPASHVIGGLTLAAGT